MLAQRKILFPVDLTSGADSALCYAATLAHAYQAQLFLCHCTPELPEDTAEKRASIREFFRTALMNSVPSPLPTESLPAYVGIFLKGDPRIVIPSLAKLYEIDLIVMRSRRRPMAAALLGSTAEAVCHHAPCSVLVTHPDEREWEGIEAGEIKLQRILAATDFSSDGQAAIEYAISLSQEYQAELDLMHVLSPAPVFTLAMSDAATPSSADFHQATLQLRSAVPSETYLWSTVREIVREGVPHREILRYAQENPISLICLGAHGSGYSEGTFFGSNSDRVLRHAPCPVLLARTQSETQSAVSQPKLEMIAEQLW